MSTATFRETKLGDPVLLDGQPATFVGLQGTMVEVATEDGRPPQLVPPSRVALPAKGRGDADPFDSLCAQLVGLADRMEDEVHKLLAKADKRKADLKRLRKTIGFLSGGGAAVEEHRRKASVDAGAARGTGAAYA